MSSLWFSCTESSLSTSLQGGKQGVQGAHALVRCGSSTSNLMEPILYTTLPHRDIKVSQTHVKNLSVPCYFCGVVVRVGSMKFIALESPRTSAQAPCTPCIPCNDVIRECLVESNHTELV